MTEAEWLTCEDPKAMLGFVTGKASDRKLRLFACVTCRLIPGFLDSEAERRCLELIERDVEEPDGAAAGDDIESDVGR
jgi:hypothetical protein